MSSQIELSWNVSAWENYTRFMLAHDTSSNLISTMYSEWKNSAWIDLAQTNWNYDGNNSNTYQLTLHYDSVAAAWINYSQSYMTYDSVNKILSGWGQGWNNLFAAWENHDSTRYYYHDQFAAVPDLKYAGNVFVYPNPAGNQFAVTDPDGEIEKIEIVNSAAAKVFMKESDHVNPVRSDCSKYSKGIYFVNIKTKKGNYTKKLVIQ
jgi:hypothetical protein